MKAQSIFYMALSIMVTALIGLVFMLGLQDKPIIDNEKAMRRELEIQNDRTIFLDNEAIALGGNPVSTELRDMAIDAYAQINSIRVQNDLNELSWNNNLETVANVRSKEISIVFSHTRPDGKAWYTVNSKIQGGENLAYGFSTATDVVDGWMDSPSHKDNILYDEFETIAISVYKVDDNYYWAQEFGY